MRILNENLRSQKQRITGFAKKATVFHNRARNFDQHRSRAQRKTRRSRRHRSSASRSRRMPGHSFQASTNGSKKNYNWIVRIQNCPIERSTIVLC
uniref:Uncharacterized protein n=1 Tax=Caenorhabditis japonica TaxID=281687 RepID=A0A8R1EY22_CAEJA